MLRVVSMLLGILVHISFCHASFWGKFWILQDPHQHIIFDILILIIRSVRMELFFFISGFFGNLMLEKNGDHYFIQNRIIKIFIPFVVCEQLMLVLMPLSINQSILNNNINYFRPFHLWFLYYLMLIYISIYLFKIIGKIIFWKKLATKIDLIFNNIMDAKSHILILSLITFLPLSVMKFIIVDTPIGFLIEYRLLIYYSVFFYFGWMTRRNLKVFDIIIKNSNIYFLIAMPNILFLIISLLNFNTNYSSNVIKFVVHIITFRCSYAICTWCLMLGIIGFFQRHLDKENKLIQYLSASSYWIYIMHLPLVLLLQHNLFSNVALGYFKPIIIFIISVAILLISYQLIVRSTYLKYFLSGHTANGKITPPITSNLLNSR